MSILFGTLVKGKSAEDSTVYLNVDTGAAMYVNYVTHDQSAAEKQFKLDETRYTKFVVLGQYLGTAASYERNEATKSTKSTKSSSNSNSTSKSRTLICKRGKRGKA